MNTIADNLSFHVGCAPYVAADGLKYGCYQMLRDGLAVATCSLASMADGEPDVIDIQSVWSVNREDFLKEAMAFHSATQATQFFN